MQYQSCNNPVSKAIAPGWWFVFYRDKLLVKVLDDEVQIPFVTTPDELNLEITVEKPTYNQSDPVLITINATEGEIVYLYIFPPEKTWSFFTLFDGPYPENYTFLSTDDIGIYSINATLNSNGNIITRTEYFEVLSIQPSVGTYVVNTNGGKNGTWENPIELITKVPITQDFLLLMEEVWRLFQAAPHFPPASSWEP